MGSKSIPLGRNRRKRSWRALRRRFQGLALSILLGGALFGIYLGYESLRKGPYFRVKEIRMVGLKRLSPSDTEARFRSTLGQNIFELDAGPIQNRLLSNPWVKESVVKKEFPDRLVLIVTERTPAAVAIDPSGAEVLLDEEGVSLERGGAYPPELPRVTHYNESAYPHALQLARLLSGRDLSTINLSDPEDLVVEAKAGTFHFGEGNYAERWRRFLEIENDLEKRGMQGREIDLRFSDKVIVKAGFRPLHQRGREAARNTPKRSEEGHL